MSILVIRFNKILFNDFKIMSNVCSFPSMIDAEQYFSAESVIALSTFFESKIFTFNNKVNMNIGKNFWVFICSFCANLCFTMR